MQPTRDPIVSPAFSPSVYKNHPNHPFQPIGSLHTPYVFIVYRSVYLFQRSARRRLYCHLWDLWMLLTTFLSPGRSVKTVHPREDWKVRVPHFSAANRLETVSDTVHISLFSNRFRGLWYNGLHSGVHRGFGYKLRPTSCLNTIVCYQSNSKCYRWYLFHRYVVLIKLLSFSIECSSVWAHLSFNRIFQRTFFSIQTDSLSLVRTSLFF